RCADDRSWKRCRSRRDRQRNEPRDRDRVDIERPPDSPVEGPHRGRDHTRCVSGRQNAVLLVVRIDLGAAGRGRNGAKICAGDSVTVDPESGDLVVKLDEPERFRLQRVPPAGGSVRDLPLGTALRMDVRPLSPGGVRDGRLLFSAATDDSWYW